MSNDFKKLINNKISEIEVSTSVCVYQVNEQMQVCRLIRNDLMMSMTRNF